MGPFVKLVGRGAAAPVLLSLAVMAIVPGGVAAQASPCAADSVALVKAVLAARPPALHSARQAELYQALVVWAERQPTPDLTERAGAFAAAYFGRKGSANTCAIVHSVVRRALLADDLDREHTLQMVADGSYRGEDPTTLQRVVALEKAVYEASAAGVHPVAARKVSSGRVAKHKVFVKSAPPQPGKTSAPTATKSAPPATRPAPAATKSAPPAKASAPPAAKAAAQTKPAPSVKPNAATSQPPVAAKAAPPQAKAAQSAAAPQKKPWWSRWWH